MWTRHILTPIEEVVGASLRGHRCNKQRNSTAPAIALEVQNEMVSEAVDGGCSIRCVQHGGTTACFPPQLYTILVVSEASYPLLDNRLCNVS